MTTERVAHRRSKQGRWSKTHTKLNALTVSSSWRQSSSSCPATSALRRNPFARDPTGRYQLLPDRTVGRSPAGIRPKSARRCPRVHRPVPPWRLGETRARDAKGSNGVDGNPLRVKPCSIKGLRSLSLLRQGCDHRSAAQRLMARGRIGSQPRGSTMSTQHTASVDQNSFELPECRGSSVAVDRECSRRVDPAQPYWSHSGGARLG